MRRSAAPTGEEPLGPFRIPGVFELYASPVGAADRVYLTDRDGTTVVIEHGDDAPSILAANTLDDEFNASMAIAGKELFLRGREFLYCIARDE